MSFPNQKRVTVNGDKKDKENLYTVLNLESITIAMHTLKNNSSFKLWCYIAKNQNNYTFDLSYIDAGKFCCLSKPTYLKGIQELIDVGYLVETSAGNYDFYERLPKENDMHVTVKRENISEIDSQFIF